LWRPQAGPQTDFVRCGVFEVVYGGARGGGKTDAALGDFLCHALVHKAAVRGLLVRRTPPEDGWAHLRRREAVGWKTM
jgi:hypothetical protein